MTIIDVRTAVLPAHTRVWRLFPGESYRFLKTFEHDKIAFLDMPGLVLPDDGPLKGRPDLKERLARSELTAIKLSREGNDKVPKISPDELANFRMGQKRQRNQQAIINFFDEASPGDLVIAPDRLVSGQVLIGRFPSRRIPPLYAHVERYGPVSVPARRINWFGRFQENTLSTKLSRALRNENAFTLLERSLFLEVFSLAFNSFAFGGQYSTSIINTKADYLDRDAKLMTVIANMAAIMCERAMKPDGGGAISAIDAILKEATIDFHCSMASDVHSPGFNRFTSAQPTPLILSACMAALLFLSGCNSKADADNARNDIEIVNSLAPDADCMAPVSKASDLLLKSMDMDTVWKLCQSMTETEHRAGVKSGSTVKPK